MVNSGGKATMLGQWRIVLRQAEESARAGRFDEALALASRPDIADHRQAVQMRGRLTLDLIARALRRAQADDVAGAIADLALAEVHGAAPDALASARLKLADQVSDEVRTLFLAGEPACVLERIDRLARHHVSGPTLRRMREAAEAWQKALSEWRRGEFGLARDALDRAERLAGGGGSEAVFAAVRRDFEARQKSAHPAIERLYADLGGGDWARILAAADAVIELVPEHPAAKQARARAWQQIAALNPGADLPRRGGVVVMGDEPAEGPTVTRALRAQAESARPKSGGRFLLWADGIGGYLVCTGEEIVLGRASPDGWADVPVLGDLSRRHAALVRSGDGYLLRAFQPTFLNNRKVDAATLQDGDVIRLGPSVELEFHQPSPVSATARLVLVSRHRFPMAVDGVILMAETCLVGATTQAHVPAPNLEGTLVLYRQGDALWCKAPGTFEVDGKSFAGRAPLTNKSSVLGGGFSFSLEPLPPRLVSA